MNEYLKQQHFYLHMCLCMWDVGTIFDIQLLVDAEEQMHTCQCC